MDSKKGAGCGLIKPGGDRYGYMGHFRAPANVKEGHNTGAPRQVKNPNYGGVKPSNPFTPGKAGGGLQPASPKVGGGMLRGKAGMKGPKMKAPKPPKAKMPAGPKMAAPAAPKPATLTPSPASRPTLSAPAAPKAPTMSTPTLKNPTMATPKLGGLLTPSIKPKLR